MRFDSLLEPVSVAEPCGPDLGAAGDSAYQRYMLVAEARLPERFFDPETGGPYDRKSVKLEAEVKETSALLARSRDLRLLVLEARFQALAGQLVGACECLLAMSALLERYWDDVHPQAADGDFGLRRNTLSGLETQSQFILPLQYAPLADSRRIDGVTLRDYLVATGQAAARTDSRDLDAASILAVLRQENNRERIEAAHAVVCSAEKALASIRDIFGRATDYAHVPAYPGLEKLLGQFRSFMEEALPPLAGVAPEQAPADEPESEAADAGSHAPPRERAAPAAAETAGVAIRDHAAAAAALLAAEDYFGRAEPSSPALILVHQARSLVGEPLVVALDTLMPESAGRALISFDPGRGLQLGMERMREITASARNGAGAAGNGADPPRFDVPDRPEAERIIQGVETFYRRSEPSSPIPMLLAKARTYMNRDFSAILSDLLRNGDEKVSD